MTTNHTIRPVPVPASEPTIAPAPPFAFRPTQAAGPWWRPRWQWAVIASTAQVAHGRAWTEAGAYRRSAQQARRWSR